MHPVFSSLFSVSPSINMRIHLSSVAEENKVSDGSGNIGVCENPQAGVGAVAGAGKKPVCVKVALERYYLINEGKIS